jgi:predicted NBD/HSP70 family sugar kinase
MAPGQPAPPTATTATTAGAILQLIRSGAVTTRADVARTTGLARSTVALRLDTLVAQGLVVERTDGPSTGGRPPARLEFNAAGGVVLAADLGATHCRLAVCDLVGTVLAERAADLDIGQGPDAVLAWVDERFGELLAEADRDEFDVRGVGVGVPGPVEFAAGRAVSPPIMPGWDGVAIPPYFARYGVPVFVDNDVNIMALGEYWAQWRETVDDLLFVKVATGIGSGLVTGGRIHRGAQGTAGDIGHIQVAHGPGVVCHCGNVDCVEAVASGSALAHQLSEAGLAAQHSRDVVDLVRKGNPDAVRLLRGAGRRLGEVLSGAVNLFNPAVIVIGGDLAHAHEQLFAGVREVVYQRSTALATRHLQIVRSRLDDRSGVVGCAVMVLDRVLSAEAVDDALSRAGRQSAAGESA